MYEEESKPSLLKPVLIGGLITGLLSLIPGVWVFNCFCCLWFIAGAFVAVLIYNGSAVEGVPVGRGAFLGLLSGAVGGGIITILLVIAGMWLGADETRFEDAQAWLIEFIETAQTGNPDQEAVDLAIEWIGELTPELLIQGLLVIGITALFIGSIFSVLGGLITAAIVGKRKQQFDEPPPPYQTS